MAYYLLDENKNKIEVTSIDQFFTTIATQFHSDLNNTNHHIEFVTQAQYNQLENDEQLVANTYYFITDDTTAEDLEQHITDNDDLVEEAMEEFEASLTNQLKYKEIYQGSNYSSKTNLFNAVENWYSQGTYQGKNTSLFEYAGSLTERVEGGTDIVYSYRIRKFHDGYFALGSRSDQPMAWAELAFQGVSSWEFEKLITESELTEAITAKTIAPTGTITKTGLYAVNFEHNGYSYSATISVTDLNDVIYGQLVSVDFSTPYKVMVMYMGHRIYWLLNEDGTERTPTSIKLICEY